MGAHIVEDEKIFAGDQGGADVVFEEGIEEAFGQFAQPLVKEFDQVVAGVKTRQFFIFHQKAITQAILLAEDDGFVGCAQNGVDFCVGNTSFAHAAVGAAVVGRGCFGFRGFCWHGGYGKSRIRTDAAPFLCGLLETRCSSMFVDVRRCSPMFVDVPRQEAAPTGAFLHGSPGEPCLFLCVDFGDADAEVFADGDDFALSERHAVDAYFRGVPGDFVQFDEGAFGPAQDSFDGQAHPAEFDGDVHVHFVYAAGRFRLGSGFGGGFFCGHDRFLTLRANTGFASARP